jgi:hypothetical protein
MRASLTSENGLDLSNLREGYLAGTFVPRQVAEKVLRRIAERSSHAEWSFLVPEAEVLARADQLATMDPALPLYGIPFSVKDNIHVESLPLTAGCPEYKTLSTTTSPVVQRLLDLGAMLIGKNTMDEFATGVVGVRSNPHPVSPINPDYIPGGSSSGSGVVVATGCVTFSLGSLIGDDVYMRASLQDKRKDFEDSRDRDSDIRSISLDSFFFFNQAKSHLLLGLDGDREDARADTFDNDLLRLRVALVHKFTLAGESNRLRLTVRQLSARWWSDRAH